MLAAVKMLGGVFVLGGIAASDVAAREAHSQVDPLVTHFQAFLASVGAGFHIFDFFDVRTSFQHGHCVLLEFPGPPRMSPNPLCRSDSSGLRQNFNFSFTTTANNRHL
jgi:hypothetical protein